jgi:hypothetical protein
MAKDKHRRINVSISESLTEIANEVKSQTGLSASAIYQFGAILLVDLYWKSGEIELDADQKRALELLTHKLQEKDVNKRAINKLSGRSAEAEARREATDMMRPNTSNTEDQ